ncbi:MAG: HAD family hydrolase, partial [Candidatus Staskawiczbacteria bacterium]|nr:HAD family hydrolase [Candidatus Staskawiczbacteria bacterium]
MVTFALSKGSLKMAKQNVVVKRLSAIEDLGNIEVLCTDKTGTLTQNKLSLEKIVSSDKKKCFLYATLASGADKIDDKILNPFDAALFQKTPDDVLRQSKKFKIISELPFDSYRMRSAFLAQSSRGEKLLIVKGAPESIIKSCSRQSFNGQAKFKELKDDITKEGEEGKRVLAIAFKKISKDLPAQAGKITVADEKGLTFLGYFVFEDPLKNTAKEAIELAKKLGVQIKIITGDSKEVAGYIARKTGLASADRDVISGQELEKLTKEEFEDVCHEKTVFARISPDVKHNIIKALQK